jgi:ADP-L-glycero-D-manno-heptose 6-epimerase
VGLKFFNVYGPNEYHKGAMRSFAAKNYLFAQRAQPVSLFRSYRPDVRDGEQKRDFVYVQDCVDVILWLVDHPHVSGLYNLGTGVPRTWRDFAQALFDATAQPSEIRYIDMPSDLIDQYQYLTQANTGRLRAAGYARPFTSLEDGVSQYVRSYLATRDPYR